MKGSTRTFVIVLAMATIVSTVATGAAVAARGGQGKGHGDSSSSGGSGDGSFTLLLVNDANGNGLPNYGDSVSFNVTSTVTYPWVQVTCYQDGSWVSNQYVGFYAGYPGSQAFPLSSYLWPGGAADCNARLFDSFNDKTLATRSFHVDA